LCHRAAVIDSSLDSVWLSDGYIYFAIARCGYERMIAETRMAHGELLIRDIIRHEGGTAHRHRGRQQPTPSPVREEDRDRLASVTGSVASSLDADTISDRC
jgi:hypothetical protein